MNRPYKPAFKDTSKSHAEDIMAKWKALQGYRIYSAAMD